MTFKLAVYSYGVYAYILDSTTKLFKDIGVHREGEELDCKHRGGEGKELVVSNTFGLQSSTVTLNERSMTAEFVKASIDH